MERDGSGLLAPRLRRGAEEAWIRSSTAPLNGTAPGSAKRQPSALIRIPEALHQAIWARRRSLERRRPMRLEPLEGRVVETRRIEYAGAIGEGVIDLCEHSGEQLDIGE